MTSKQSKVADSNIQNRRQFLRRTVGGGVGAGTVLLAGCLGDDDPGDPAPDDDDDDVDPDPADDDDDEPDEEFPTQRFDVVIPWGQGGGTDIFTRQIWQVIADQHGVSAAFENVTGAAGVRGITELYHAEPNGYNVGPMNSPSVVPLLVQEPGFTIDEFRHIGAYTETTWVLVTDPGLDVPDFEELVDMYDRGDIETIAGQRPGEPNHILAELLKSELGVPWQSYVSYDGSGPINEAVAAGEVSAGIVTETAAEAAQEQVDVLVALASGGSYVFPDLPVYTDYGYEPEIDFMGSFVRSFMAPPETPDDRVEILTDSLEEALESPEMQEWAEETGNRVEFLGGEEFVLDVLAEASERIPEVIDLDELR